MNRPGYKLFAVKTARQSDLELDLVLGLESKFPNIKAATIPNNSSLVWLFVFGITLYPIRRAKNILYVINRMHG